MAVKSEENHVHIDKNTDRVFLRGQITHFKDRLKEAMKGESGNSLSKRSGLSEAVIRAYLSGKTYPSLDRLEKLAEAVGCSVGWLAAGVSYNQTQLQNVNDVNLVFKYEDVKSNDDYVIVPELNVTVAAGNGIYPLTESEVGQFIFSKIWLNKEGLSNANLSLIHVMGDSMENTIHDGDIALVNVKEEGWTGALDGVFVILVNDLLMVKRLQYDIIDNGYHIISDNPLYKPFFIKLENSTHFKVIAKVERILTKMSQVR